MEWERPRRPSRRLRGDDRLRRFGDLERPLDLRWAGEGERLPWRLGLSFCESSGPRGLETTSMESSIWSTLETRSGYLEQKASTSLCWRLWLEGNLVDTIEDVHIPVHAM